MFDPREVATLLAALQFWKEEMCPHPEVILYYLPLDRFEPLSAVEIDRLRARLNLLLPPDRSAPA